MKSTDIRPTAGQFVAIWFYNNLIWSGTFKYIDEKLHEFQPLADDWERSFDTSFLDRVQAKYFVIED